MILEKLKHLEVERVGDTQSGIKAGIAEESLPFVFELVSKNLYSDAIGSIARELTSNCFDSHIEAGVTDPVVISKTYDTEEGYSIEFKDVGIGLSRERLVSIYMNYFSSTKRNTNEQIGGFGIGSKTPLAYTDMFYITTRFNGMEYACIMHKGEEKPELESLYGWDEVEEAIKDIDGIVTGETITKKYPTGIETDEHNGTVIRIVLQDVTQYRSWEDKKNDIEKFKEALKYQLSYFHNVYFNNWDISNDYDIYEGKHFKFRSDINQENTNVHLCIGDVRYKIDFDKVAVPKECKNMPIAVKFDIGELQVTPSREAIRYNDATSALIADRVKMAYNELKEMFDEQNPIIEDLADFSRLGKETPSIRMPNEEKEHKIRIWSYAGFSKKFKFAPLNAIGVKNTPENMFFMYRHIGNIKSDGKSHMFNHGGHSVDNDFILQKRYILWGKEDKVHSYTDINLSREYGRGTEVAIIKRIKLTDKDYKPTAIALGIKDDKSMPIAKTIVGFLKIIDKEVRKRGRLYSDFKPDIAWINSYKASLREASAAYLRKINKKIYCKDATRDFSGMELYEHEMKFRTGILVYGYKEDREILKSIALTVRTNNEVFKKKGNKKEAFMVIQIAKSAESSVKGANKKVKNIYVEDFVNTKFFRKIVTAKHIYEELQKLRLDGIEIRQAFIAGFKESFDAVKTLISKYYRDPNNFDVDEIFLSRDYIPEMMKVFNDFKEKYSYKIPLIGCLTHSDIIRSPLKIESVADYLKDRKIKLRNEFYLIPQQGNLNY